MHLRFLFSSKTLPRLLLPYIGSRKADYGRDVSQGLRDPADPCKGRKKIIVEFSSPNVANDFNDAHLRSTLIGAFVSNMYECMGWDVVRLNYLGDWGKQIGLLAVGWQRFGLEDDLEGPDPLGHLLGVSSKIEEEFKPELLASKKAKEEGLNTAEIEGQGIFAERDAFFKRMEEGDEAALALWKRFRAITISDLTMAYQRLGIKFDEYAGESQVKPETVAEVESVLKEKGVLEESDGSWIVDFAKHGAKNGLGTTIIRGRTGSTTYLLRDIAAALDRERAYGFDKMVYVVSARQETHFLQLFAALDLLGRSDLRENVQRVSFGRIQGLSEHLKDARSLSAILDGSVRLMQDAVAADAATEGDAGEEGKADGETTAAVVRDAAVVSAILAQDMFGKRGHPSVFDPRHMTLFDAHTGPKLQVCYAQLSAAITGLSAQEGVEAAEVDYDSLQGEDAADMLRLMAQYPDVIALTFKLLEPHTLLTYLFRLGDCVSASLIGAGPDGGEGEEGEEAGSSSPAPAQEAPSAGEKKARLVLYENARQVLENGMKLLGFPIVAS